MNAFSLFRTALFALALMAFGAALAQEGAERQGNLRVAIDIPVQLDPAFASSDAEIAVINAVYDYLVDVDADNLVQPRLARSWEVSEDGLVYTFTLAQATFHDGSPLRAEDVVWTFDRLRDPELELPTSSLYENIESIEAQDGEVVFTLAETNPFFLYDLSDNHAVILKEGTEDAATSFNGTGPFRVVNYSPENRMQLSANEDYFEAGMPRVETLEFIFFSDQTASVDAVRGGQVDLVIRMPNPLFLAIQNEPGLTPLEVATNQFDLVRLRADREPGNDPRVVEAMKLATDRQAIFDVVGLGFGAVGSDTPVGPLYSQFASDLEPPARDPERARELLAEAGYEGGLELDMHVPNSGNRPDLAVVLAEQWAEAGLNVNVVLEPESVYYGDDGWLEVTLGITGWGSRPTPQFYFDVMLVCDAVWNESRFCDPDFDALAQTARTTLDDAERAQAYREMHRILLEDAPIIIPYFSAQFGALRDEFTNFELKAFPGRSDLRTVERRD